MSAVARKSRQNAKAVSAAIKAGPRGFPQSDPNVPKTLTRVERAALGQIRPSKKCRFDWRGARISEIKTIIFARHGTQIPENDDIPGPYLFAMFQHMFGYYEQAGDACAAFKEWIADVAPWLQNPNGVTRQLLASMRPDRKPMSKTACARLLRVSLKERDRLGLRTITCYDLTPKDMRTLQKERKRVADRERAAEKRRLLGATPRGESLMALKPWIDVGCSKRTWERHRKKERERMVGTPELPPERKRKSCDADPSRVISLRRGRDENASLEQEESALGVIDDGCFRSPVVIVSRGDFIRRAFEVSAAVLRRGRPPAFDEAIGGPKDAI